MEICEEISLPSFFRKMLMSAFLLRFKANYLETRRLKAIPWDALARERSIGMNCEVRVKCNDQP